MVEVELIHGGEDTVTFTPLLVVDDDGKTHVGKEVARAQVKAKLAGEKKGEKVKVFKYRPKTGYAKRQGHRQMYTLVEINDITLPKARAAAAPKKEEAPAEAAAEAAGRTAEAAAERRIATCYPGPTMAHKKGGGSTRNGRDSKAKRLGVKAFAGQDGYRRLDPGPSAGHEDPPRRRRREGRRRHPVRQGHGDRHVPLLQRPPVRLDRTRPSPSPGAAGRPSPGESPAPTSECRPA